MEKNIRPCERVARIVIGLAIASLAFWGPKSPWFLLGLVPVLFGALGWCPLYTRLGIDTNKCCGPKCCCSKKDQPQA